MASLQKKAPSADGYSVGYQIGPDYPGAATWAGTPYALSEGRPPCGEKDGFRPFAPPDEKGAAAARAARAAADPVGAALGGGCPSWARPDGSSYGLPPASDRPDFWAGDPTVHTYLARDPIPALCPPPEVAEGRRRLTPAEQTAVWRYYGGPKGWNMSPYY